MLVYNSMFIFNYFLFIYPSMDYHLATNFVGWAENRDYLPQVVTVFVSSSDEDTGF